MICEDPLRQAVGFRGQPLRSAKAFNTGTHRAVSPEQTFATIRPYLARAGVTRIADVTGLDHIGVPTTLAIRPNATTMACSSGKGITLDQAIVSGAMEAFELHAAETTYLPSIRATYRELAGSYAAPKLANLPLSRDSLFTPEWPYNWCLGWDLISQAEVPVPYATVGMSRSQANVANLGAFQVSSNGLGAGNSLLEAMTSALYEVIERDAVACQHYAAMHNNHIIPLFAEAELRSRPLVASVLERCDRADVRVVVYDSSGDTQVPTYVAIAYDRTDHGVGLMKGSGSHLDPEVALLRAINESLQARLNFIAGSRDDIFRSAFTRARSNWRPMMEKLENAFDADSAQGKLSESRAAATFEEDIHHLLNNIRRAGIENVVVFDLTPEDFPVHIVRVVVPGMEGYMHHGYRPGPRACAAAGRELP
ncbi:MAG: YcaO-like family protein [Terracidiphilus sp.]|jgi:ribosomal protein S12 methylthiotransferase accessory factor